MRGPFVDLDPAEVKRAIEVTAYGGFLVAREAARRMVPKNHGAILLTGASAGVKGYPQSAPFAMGKFALRGLAQSMARELHPQGIHVAHFVIDGGIARADRAPSGPDALLDPDAIAVNYLNVLRQPRSAWTWEIELQALGREVLNFSPSPPCGSSRALYRSSCAACAFCCASVRSARPRRCCG